MIFRREKLSGHIFQNTTYNNRQLKEHTISDDYDRDDVDQDAMERKAAKLFEPKASFPLTLHEPLFNFIEQITEDFNRLRADDFMFVFDDKQGDARQTDQLPFPSGFIHTQRITAVLDGAEHFLCIKPAFPGNSGNHIRSADIQALRKVGMKHVFMESIMQALIAGKFRGHQRQSGIREDFQVAEHNPDVFAACAQLLKKRREVMPLESLREHHSRGRCFRMQFVTYPGIVNGVFFFQLVDKALADITEGSNIIGKYFEVNHHILPAWKRLDRFLILP